MDPIAPKEIRYIKLGSGNTWAASCLAAGELQFGYSTIPHDLCLRGDWDAVTALLLKEGRKLAKAKDALREIRDFYSLGSDCLWITFADGHLWWAFAEAQVTWLGDKDPGRGSRKRQTLDGWHRSDVRGVPLRIDALSTRLTQIAAYRQTICQVRASDYLLRRINGVEEPILKEARQARAAMIEAARAMIASLHWADFETLIDLIFARGGWQRVSQVGGSQADIDLILEQPTTAETACIQVKSKASQAVLDESIAFFRRSGAYDRLFFVCHSPQGTLNAEAGEAIHVWAGDRLAEVAVQAGLVDWLMERCA